MSRRIIAVLALALGLLAPSMGHTAVVSPQITDAQGDANGINSQENPALQSPALKLDSMTPKLGAQPAEYLDILSVRFSTEVIGGKATNLLIALALNGDPRTSDLPHRYDVYFHLGDCVATQYVFWASNPTVNPDLPAVPTVRDAGPQFASQATYDRGNCNDNAKKGIALTKTTFAGKTITFRIPLAEVGKAGVVLNSFHASAHVRSYADAVTWDVASSAKTYRIGT